MLYTIDIYRNLKKYLKSLKLENIGMTLFGYIYKIYTSVHLYQWLANNLSF